MIYCPVCEPGLAGESFTPVLCAECSERNAATRALRADCFGYSATCTVCGRGKQPVGRSAPIGMMMCNPHHPIIDPHGCVGYNQEPLPSHLWPGESEADFGYRVPR